MTSPHQASVTVHTKDIKPIDTILLSDRSNKKPSDAHLDDATMDEIKPHSSSFLAKAPSDPSCGSPFDYSYFIGVPDISRKGKHPVLIYRIPDQEQLCYIFCFHRENRGSKIYRCLGCKDKNKFTRARVTQGIFFESDPCFFDHCCDPKKWTYERGRRIYYEKIQDWKRDSRCERNAPKSEYKKLLNEVKNHPSLSEEERDAALSYLKDYNRIRVTVSRSLSRRLDSAVESAKTTKTMSDANTKKLEKNDRIVDAKHPAHKAIFGGTEQIVFDGSCTNTRFPPSKALHSSENRTCQDSSTDMRHHLCENLFLVKDGGILDSSGVNEERSSQANNILVAIEQLLYSQTSERR